MQKTIGLSLLLASLSVNATESYCHLNVDDCKKGDVITTTRPQLHCNFQYSIATTKDVLHSCIYIGEARSRKNTPPDKKLDDVIDTSEESFDDVIDPFEENFDGVIDPFDKKG